MNEKEYDLHKKTNCENLQPFKKKLFIKSEGVKHEQF